MNSSERGCPVCLRADFEMTDVPSAIPQGEGPNLENRTHSDDGSFVDCPACGQFVVTSCDDVNLRSDRLRSEWDAAQVSALLREQTILKLPPYWLRCGMAPYGPLDWPVDLAPIDLGELLDHWPRTVAERINRTLCNLARLSPTGGYSVDVSDDDIALAFAESPEEMQYHIQALMHDQLIEGIFMRGIVGRVVLTPAGWARFQELIGGRSDPGNPVFVAMWFGDAKERAAMDEVFQEGIRPAIELAGYRSTRVDLVEHNDWIMDQVLGDIRLSPFVVADFTGHRNGVYFEAGFARGLGVPVIHTCREEQIDKAHFDTVQLNHVLWKSPDELRQKLFHRIVGAIGKGPHAAAVVEEALPA